MLRIIALLVVTILLIGCGPNTTLTVTPSTTVQTPGLIEESPVIQITNAPPQTATTHPTVKSSISPSSQDVSPTALTGYLVVRTTPSRVKIELEGENVGQSPLEISVSPGEYVLTLMLDHYEPWQSSVRVTATEVVTVQAQLRFQPFELYRVETDVDPSDRIANLLWNSNERLVYAIDPQMPDILGIRPYEWTWHLFDVPTGHKESLPAPLSPISSTVLEALGIIPWKAAFSVSPDGTQFVYTLFDDCREQTPYAVLDCPVWWSNKDGTNRILLGWAPQGPGSQAYFSPENDWVIIYSWEEGGSPWRFLARTDGTFWGELEEHFGLKNAYGCTSPPAFSPDGDWLAIEADSLRTDCICATWVIHMTDGNAVEVGGKGGCFVGPVHWSKDSRRLYVLQKKTLYRVVAEDLFTKPTILAEQISYSFPSLPELIAVSPDETMIALTGLGRGGDLILVQFAPK